MTDKTELISLTADIVAAHVANNTVAVGDMPNLVRQVYDALSSLGAPEEQAEEKKTPVVSVRASIKPEYLICMECGRKQKTLRRHLQTAHQMTPDQYRKDYGLPDTYPMTASNYSERRREMAKSIGLGTKGRGGNKAAPESSGRKRAASTTARARKGGASAEGGE